jgi:hypothetical protein
MDDNTTPEVRDTVAELRLVVLEPGQRIMGELVGSAPRPGVLVLLEQPDPATVAETVVTVIVAGGCEVFNGADERYLRSVQHMLRTAVLPMLEGPVARQALHLEPDADQ